MENRITQMMQELDKNKLEKKSLEEQLHELTEERKNIDIERSKNKLTDPEAQEKAEKLDKEISDLQAKINENNKSREQLEK